MNPTQKIYAVDLKIHAFSYKIKAYSIMDILDIEIIQWHIYIYMDSTQTIYTVDSEIYGFMYMYIYI